MLGTGEGIYERSKRDSEGIEKSCLPETILGYDHCEPGMQFNRAVSEAPEVAQDETIYA
jgi:hypothetical protein